MNEDKRYLSAVSALCGQVQQTLSQIDPAIQAQVHEIRLRADRPVALTAYHQILFVGTAGQTSAVLPQNAFVAKKKDLLENFLSLCGWSVHTHQREAADGFISVRGGHRAGIAATAAVKDGSVQAVRDITSINLRIAREMFGTADRLVACLREKMGGMLLVGAPSSGKTTLLRDLARQMASGGAGGYQKVCVVDKSGELGGASGGDIQNDLGLCCDLLSGYPKDKGLQIAIRYFSPRVIVCDEIYTKDEIRAIVAAANSGVAVVTSVHASDTEELLRKPQLKELLHTGAFEHIVFLEGPHAPSKIRDIKRMDELCRE